MHCFPPSSHPYGSLRSHWGMRNERGSVRPYPRSFPTWRYAWSKRKALSSVLNFSFCLSNVAGSLFHRAGDWWLKVLPPAGLWEQHMQIQVRIKCQSCANCQDSDFVIEEMMRIVYRADCVLQSSLKYINLKLIQIFPHKHRHVALGCEDNALKTRIQRSSQLPWQSLNYSRKCLCCMQRNLND